MLLQFTTVIALLARQLTRICLLALLCGCAGQPRFWVVDSISADDPTFDFSRIRYVSKQAHAPFLFEIHKVSDRLESFLSLNRFRLKESREIKVTFCFNGQEIFVQIPVHEGGMRLRLPEEITNVLIEALQDGHKIGILLDDFEETLDPSQFSDSFSEFKSVQGTNFFKKMI